MAKSDSLSDPDFARCLEHLRQADRDRYLACLLSPARHRGALAALYAFNAEIARIRDVVSEPMPGEVRLQWWRDLIAGSPHGAAAANPLAAALMKTIERCELPQGAFDGYLQARIFDLYDDPMPDRTHFEGHAGETAATIIQLAAQILVGPDARGTAEAAGHAGVAQLVAGSLLLLPVHRRRGQLYLPADLIAATGLDREAFLKGPDAGGAARTVEAFIALGREHLARADAALDAAPPDAFPAFLPAALAPMVFARAARDPAACLETPPLAPQWRRQWRLLQALRRGRLG